MTMEEEVRHQVVDVFGAQADVRPYDQPVYRRTIQTRAVTFTCQGCGRQVTQQRYPGPPPRYCSEWCRYRAQRAQTRERVRRLRARRHDQEQSDPGLSDAGDRGGGPCP
jgi:hypothetical protein